MPLIDILTIKMYYAGQKESEVDMSLYNIDVKDGEAKVRNQDMSFLAEGVPNGFYRVSAEVTYNPVQTTYLTLQKNLNEALAETAGV
ncbi:MAG: hypothetical protein KBC48_02790 [Candidatus Pacebacteria bacterium]|nr:hypothetical protein [Candidatus Paceibacterota bacterium]